MRGIVKNPGDWIDHTQVLVLLFPTTCILLKRMSYFVNVYVAEGANDIL